MATQTTISTNHQIKSNQIKPNQTITSPFQSTYRNIKNEKFKINKNSEKKNRKRNMRA